MAVSAFYHDYILGIFILNARRSKNVIQLEQPPNHQTKLTPVVKNKSQFKGIFIATVIVSCMGH